jgi:hypothetical protein
LPETFNIYCDESCHLEHDHQAVMILGAIWAPLAAVRDATERLREIKLRHGLPRLAEIKWTKISPGNLPFYLEILDSFFANDRLNFRALIADKSDLRHVQFGQTHDEWYYKMYFDLLKWILQPGDRFRIYLDIKDTRSASKIRKLHDVLANNFYDFSRDIVERVQTVRSHEVELLQLADVLIGALAAANRPDVTKSPAKRVLVERLRERSRYSLRQSTLMRERKFNLFHWQSTSSTTGA